MNLAGFWADPRVALTGVALLLLAVLCSGLRPGRVVSEGGELPAAAVDPLFFAPLAQPLLVDAEGALPSAAVQVGNVPRENARTVPENTAEPGS